MWVVLRKPGRDIEKNFFCRGEYFLGRGEYFLGRGEYFLPRGIFSRPRGIFFAAGNIFSAARNIVTFISAGNIFWAAGIIFCRGEYCYISFPRRIFNFRGEYLIPRVILYFRGEHSSFHIRGEYSIPAMIFYFLLETSVHSLITPVFHITKLRHPHTRALRTRCPNVTNISWNENMTWNELDQMRRDKVRVKRKHDSTWVILDYDNTLAC